MDGIKRIQNPSCNDMHSALNPTEHARVLAPTSSAQIAECLRQARACGQRVAIAGARHAMGGQQFLTGGWLLDLSDFNGVLDFDPIRGWVRVAAGTRWPQLQAFLRARRAPDGSGWAIRQKQTGADELSLGGAVAANIHGRGLDFAPLVEDIERLTLLTPSGDELVLDRQQNATLFALVVGGYGLFGVVTDLTLRLVPRLCLQRRVQLLRRAELAAAFTAARAAGANYGDFQFAIDPNSGDFLDLGVFACYYAVDQPLPNASPSHELSSGDWRELLLLAHVDKSAAFARYSAFYLASDAQHYASDDHQFGVYVDGYHAEINARLGHEGSEVITELYVPLGSLDAFLGNVAETARHDTIDLIYGTVRLIRRDHETVLSWARDDFACVVLNVHVAHHDTAQAKAARDFRRLIDLALSYRGSYYLTYHRHADARQMRAAYPRLAEFMAAKRDFDPEELLSSDWYCAVRAKLAQA